MAILDNIPCDLLGEYQDRKLGVLYESWRVLTLLGGEENTIFGTRDIIGHETKGFTIQFINWFRNHADVNVIIPSLFFPFFFFFFNFLEVSLGSWYSCPLSYTSGYERDLGISKTSTCLVFKQFRC